jgi:hypothetical protein
MYPLEFNRMSLATAIIGSDGIVLASDAVETEGEGEYQSNNAHKVERITDSVWMACVSNYAGYTNRLVADFINGIEKQSSKKQEQLDIVIVSEYFESYTNNEYKKLRQQDSGKMYQHRPPRDQFFFIFAGYTNDVMPNPKIRVAGFTEGLPSPLPPFSLEDYSFYPCGVKQTASYWMFKINRIRRLDTIDSKTLKALTILMFVETIKMTKLVGPPLDIVTIKPTGVPEKITISEIELKQIEKKMGAVIGEEIILDRLAQLEGDLP